MKTPVKLMISCLLLFVYCGKDGSNPVTYGNDFVQIKQHQQWTYRETYIYDGIVNSLDTMFIYTHFRHSADTVINGLPYLTIEETTYGLSDFSVDTGTIRFYINIGVDTIFTLWAKDEYSAAMSPLFKVKKSEDDIDTVVPPFDTSRFSDLTCSLVFPLTANQSWKFRPQYRGLESIPVQRTFGGDEKVTVPGGTFDTWKIDFTFLDSEFAVFQAGSTTDWVSKTGLVKRVVDFPVQTQYDIMPFETDSIGTYDPYFFSEYIGTEPVDGQILKPLLPGTVIDSVKRAVKMHWNYDKFVKWCLPYIRGLMFDSTDLIHQNVNLYGVDELIMSIWGGNERTNIEAITMLSSNLLPSEEDDFHRYDYFLYYILNLPVSVPGWIDCEADTSDPAIPDLTPPLRCSTIRDNLINYVYSGR